MKEYIFKRLLLFFPTLLGILILNFAIIHITPGGPIETIMAKMHGIENSTLNRINAGPTVSQAGHERSADISKSEYKASRGLDTEYVDFLKAKFGFDKPLHVRFLTMVKDYTVFDFGKSYFKDQTVIGLLIESLPVSISLGLWSSLLIYLISIPLGIKKATLHQSKFDVTTSFMIIVGYAIPAFLFAILLIIFFAGGTYFNWFPIRGLVSEDWENLSLIGKVLDYFWHITIPVITLTIGGFAAITMLTKNSFLEEISKQYALTAKAKGLENNTILYKHIFRNAMLIVIAGFPAALIGILFTGSLIIEVIFSLNGLGLLGYEAALNRDYPIIFGVLYLTTFIGLVISLISDLMYVWIDPRIDFEGGV